jgi:hypothetical protein
MKTVGHRGTRSVAVDGWTKVLMCPGA